MDYKKYQRLVLTDKTEEARRQVRERVTKLAGEYGVTVHRTRDISMNSIDGTSVQGVDFTLSGEKLKELLKRLWSEYDNMKYIRSRA